MPLKLPGSSKLQIPSPVWDADPTNLLESSFTASNFTAGWASGPADVAVRDALTALGGLLDSTPLDAAAGHAGFSAAPPAWHLPDGLWPTIADARPGQPQAVMQADPRGVDF